MRIEKVASGMTDFSILIGTVGALAGVGLGSWLAARSQRALFRDSHVMANVNAREVAYEEFLTTARQFRRFLMTQPMQVQLIERPENRPSTPVIDDPGDHWKSLDAALAKLAILAGDRSPHHAASEVLDSIYEIARSRAVYAAGEIPDDIILLGRAAEKNFAQAAREDLMRSREPNLPDKRFFVAMIRNRGHNRAV